MVRLGHGFGRARRGHDLLPCRQADRPNCPARAERQSLFRRPQAQPLVYGSEPVGLCAVRQHPGGARRLTGTRSDASACVLMAIRWGSSLVMPAGTVGSSDDFYRRMSCGGTALRLSTLTPPPPRLVIFMPFHGGKGRRGNNSPYLMASTPWRGIQANDGAPASVPAHDLDGAQRHC